MFYEDVLRELQEQKVRYLIVGGAAVNLHGVPRMTADLDIVVDLSRENVEALLKAMNKLMLVTAAPVNPEDMADPDTRAQWQAEKNLKALTFQREGGGSSYREVDVVLDMPLPFSDLYDSRVELKAGDLILNLISIKHLKEIKKKIGRAQDLADVESLDKIDNDHEG